MMVPSIYSRASDIIVPDRLSTDPVSRFRPRRDVYEKKKNGKAIVAPVAREPIERQRGP